MKKSYKPGRDRRVAQPGTPGGRIAGINVCAFEFRVSEGVVHVSMHVVNPSGVVQAADLGLEIGAVLPVEGITLLNATNPGSPASVYWAEYLGNGTVYMEISGLGAAQVGTLLIPPMLAGWGDSTGRVIGGVYASVPAV